MPHEYSWWGPMWFFPMFVPIAVVIILLVGLYLIFGRGGAKRLEEHYQARESETALDILKKRYAKGEITKEEFEQMKRDIT